MAENIGSHVYHATQKKYLKAISRSGLHPRNLPNPEKDPELAVKGKAVFFAPFEDMASQWGGVVLRFPWPEEYDEDSYGDSIQLKSGEIVRTSYYTRDAIPPEFIEVKMGDCWCPIQKYRKQDSR